MVGFWIRGAQGAIKGFKALKKFKGQKLKKKAVLEGSKIHDKYEKVEKILKKRK